MTSAPRPQPPKAIDAGVRTTPAGRSERAERAGRRLVLPFAAAVLLLLTACDGPLVMHQRSGTEATPAALAHAWSTPATQPDWVPSDSRHLRFMAKTLGPADETPAVVRVDTASALPASCAASSLDTSPALAPGWAPGMVATHVTRCGNWAVVPVPGGWFGWTPAG